MVKQKKCKAISCGEKFTPFSTTQMVCSNITCSLEYIRQQEEKKEAREQRKAKQSLKTRSDFLKDAIKAFNAYIRERDKDDNCISCGGSPSDHNLITGSRFDAGHYFGTGAHPAMRFVENNVHKQCVRCNRPEGLSGNIHNYRPRLIKKIGVKAFEELEKEAYQGEPKKYTIDDLKEIIIMYRQKAKELRINHRRG